ncbi:MAG TPA: ABC transporter substrate-binding protein [Candidatus Blautia merdavium]|uniref:ABC transporter substrate-binding protein n=1 Tax=Candidatus Blautia merdavium TaxID=2838494 RepID=A0A9D2TC76_9FIRM|nr:ABC transporter substrate-binding protein [Candidatus Blautia merdavium]
MKKFRNLCLLLLTVALTAVLGGCQDGKDGSTESQDNGSSQETEAEPTMGGSIVVGIPQDLEDSLDPHKSVAAGTKEVLFNIYEGLVKPDEEGNYIDAVAESHSISEDGKVYNFQLRSGVKFHDGTEVTVDDVKYSIERCAGINGDGTPLVAAFSNVEKVETPDASTVEIYLKEADTEFLAYLIVAVVPQHCEDLDKNPVGTGPFQYVSRSPQENIVIEKFSDYWDTENQAYLDQVTFKVVGDSNAIVTGLKSGTIDMYPRVNATQAAQLADDQDLQIYEGGMNLIQALYLNNAEAPFDDVKVRQALCYAVNRQEVLDMVADGKGTIIGSSMFPAFEKYYMPELADLYPQDVQKAKELLAEAGYPDGFDMTISVPNNYQQHIDTAQVLVEQLKQIGVNAEIQLIEWDSWLSDVYADRNFQSTVVGIDAAYLSGRALLERFASDAEKNFINYSNPQYDTLYEQVKKSTDDSEQIDLYKQMETLLAEDAANVYIQDMAAEVVLRKGYGGYVFYPLYVQDMAKIYKTAE